MAMLPCRFWRFGWMLPCRQCTIDPAAVLARLALPQAITNVEAGIKYVQAATCISTGATAEANIHP